MARLTRTQRDVIKFLYQNASKTNPYSVSAIASALEIHENTIRRLITTYPDAFVTESVRQPSEYYLRMTPFIRGVIQQLTYTDPTLAPNDEINDKVEKESAVSDKHTLPPVAETNRWRYIKDEEAVKHIPYQVYLDKLPEIIKDNPTDYSYIAGQLELGVYLAEREMNK